MSNDGADDNVVNATAEGVSTPGTARDSAQEPARQQSTRRRTALRIGIACLLTAALAYGLYWWLSTRFIETTDDAYLHADQVSVASRVSGTVNVVFVRDNQMVAAGDLIAQIDPAPGQATLMQRDATRMAREADIGIATLQARQKHIAVLQAQARLKGDTDNLRFTLSQVARYRGLASTGAEASEKLAQMRNQSDQARATRDADQAALDAASRDAEASDLRMQQSAADLAAARASLRSAQIDLDHTKIRAPISGRIGDRTLRLGQYLQPGSRLLTIVPISDIYVVANFKETQVTRMRVGQPATVSVDALGSRDLHAVIDSFSPGTGAQFALLPADNATGNFTKIVQRVPVRLRLEADQQTIGRLIPGLSVSVSIDTARNGTDGDKAAP